MRIFCTRSEQFTISTQQTATNSCCGSLALDEGTAIVLSRLCAPSAAISSYFKLVHPAVAPEFTKLGASLEEQLVTGTPVALVGFPE